MEGIIILIILMALFLFLKKSEKKGARKKRSGRRNRIYPKKISGKTGESYVALNLANSKNNFVINDYLIQLDENKSSQIDHILINKHGIWVIETKTYSGKIYGSEDHLEWTQVLAFGKEKHRFYNPIKQNATHIYHLRKIVGMDAPVYSLVVFVTGDISEVNASGVCTYKNMMQYIQKHGTQNVTEEQMAIWYRKLMQQKAGVTITEEDHIRNVQAQQKNLEEGICPRCGAKLVLREGGRGNFYGCSGYPNCKFTMKADD